MLGSKFGEDFAVEGKASFLQFRDESAVRFLSVVANGGIQADNPEFTEIGLLIMAVSEGIPARAHKRFVCETLLLGTNATVALGSFQNILAAFLRHDSSFDSCHTKMITKINYFAPEPGRKRRRVCAERVMATGQRLLLRSAPLCFALKWS